MTAAIVDRLELPRTASGEIDMNRIARLPGGAPDYARYPNDARQQTELFNAFSTERDAAMEQMKAPTDAPVIKPTPVISHKPTVAQIARMANPQNDGVLEEATARAEATRAACTAELEGAHAGGGAVSLLAMAGDHPLANYSREVADSIQISRDSTFLIGLGLTSGIVGSVFRTCPATYVSLLPIGLYVTAEQPPASGKSGVMRAFQDPYRAVLKDVREKRNTEAQAVQDQIDATDDKEQIADLKIKLACLPKPIRGWITNATPEALEKEAIAPNGGFFMLASDERGLLNSLFGLTYGKGGPTNMDAALQGFDGGYYSSVRATREGFDGYVHGSIVCFAQPGSIEAIARSSDGSGVAERFLWLSDGHNLGKRNHLRQYRAPNRAPYQLMCQKIGEMMPAKPDMESLINVALPAGLAQEMGTALNEQEPEMGDGGRFGSDMVRGAAGKLDLQVMKMAAVLHVSRYLMRGEAVPANIKPEDFGIALRICRELVDRYRAALVEKRIIGLGAEADAVIEYLEKRGWVDMRTAKNSLRSKAAFKGVSTKQIEAVIDKLIGAQLIDFDIGAGGTTKRIKLK